MSPFFLSLLAGMFVLCAFGAAMSMLEAWGNDKTRFSDRALTIFHRTCGYSFITIYLIMLYFMLRKIVFQQEPLTPLATVHVAFAVLIFPVLFVKIMIIRRFKGLKDKLPYFGVTVFSLGITLNVITAGFYFLRAGNVNYVSLTSYDRSRLSADVGRGLMEKKCVKCHTLERVFLAVKTEDQWTKTVNEMVVRDPGIVPDEAVQIIYYLSSGRSVESSPQSMMLAGLSRTDQKCGRCHLLDKVYGRKRTKTEWAKLVEGYSKAEPIWITREDAKIIKEYLGTAHSEEFKIVKAVARIGKVEQAPPPKPREMTFAEKFEETCNACHSSERILKKADLLGSDKDRWKSIVLAMQKKGADVEDTDIDKFVGYLITLKH